jgi:poly(A) polymerase
MRLSGEDKKRVIELVVNLPRFNDVFSMRSVTLNRWVREPFFPELLQLHRAASIARDGNQMPYQFALRLHEQLLSGGEIAKLITGEDLIQLGFQPGPTFSEILRVVEDLSIEKKLSNKDQALEYVLKHFVR